MKTCLCPGRPLRPGLRSLAFHLPLFPRRSVAHRRPGFKARNQRKEIWPEVLTYPKQGDIRILSQFFRRGQLVPPVPEESRGNPEAWIPYLTRCLPPSPSDAASKDDSGPAPSVEHSKEFLQRCSRLAELMYSSRERLQSDILVHMGFTMKDWSTVHALLSTLVDGYDLLAAHMTPQQPSPGFDWGSTSGRSFDELTASSTSWPKPVPADAVSLDTLTVRPLAKDLSQRFLAQVWQSLGSLVLAAADQPPEESKLAMSYVFRTLARLHHSGLISDRVYQYPESGPNQLLFRPPSLHLLSGHIMSVLSDAAWLEHQAAVAARAAAVGEESPYLSIKMGVRELGPEIWLELILWCCVEHGYSKEGAWLVNQMKAQTGPQPWKIESWAPLVEALDVVQQTNISTEQFWRRPGSDPQPSQSWEKPPFSGLGYRTISSEVLTSLRNSLTNKIYLGIGWTGYRPNHLLRLSAHLSSWVDPVESVDDVRPTNSTNNWYMVRFLETGGIEPLRDPATFERLLRSHNKVVPPWDGDKVSSVQHLNRMTKKEIYDASALMIGLLEYNIKAYAADRQSGRTFHVYAWLLNIVDASKLRHIETFFEQLSRSGAKDITFFDSQQPHPPLESPLPQLSTSTFADMLDLATASRSFDFGDWLLFSKDVDGPSIPRRLYGQQNLAPSILRFAAATQNFQLCQQVIASLKAPLSVNTLKALINYHISVGDWDRSILMLNYIRDHKSQSWGYSNITTLAAAIIRRDASIRRKQTSGTTVSEEETQDLDRAKDMFLRFFNGEFTTRVTRQRTPDQRTRSFQQKALFRMSDLLSTLPGPLPELVAQAELQYVAGTRDRLSYLPPVAFHVLLSAIVDHYGSYVGKQLWDRWCLDPLSPRRTLVQRGGVSRLRFARERVAVSGEAFDHEWLEELQSKAVDPNLNTIRIIAQAAAKEFEAEQKAQQSQTQLNSDTNTPTLESPQPPADFLKKTPFKVSRSIYKYQSISNKNDPDPPSCTAEAVLDFCVAMYFRLGLGEHEVDRETQGHVKRMRRRKVFNLTAKETRDTIRDIRDDPWMDDSWYNPVGGWPVLSALESPSPYEPLVRPLGHDLTPVRERVLTEGSGEAYR